MSLYLKYRPINFENLVGQEFIKNTLKKAIEDNKLVWAYLFCWPRWTGKTSTARILAKTINCLNPKRGEPCLECEICRDFLSEKLIDIIEIDAASHTGVDNIRDIIEKALFQPTKTKYKIYIIDEVHMLSKWAFNALLKILEEPPEHVKFILATTETHKVPDTIISRCQRYDFRRVGDLDMKKRLLSIASLEKVKIDDESLDYIIKNSWWWVRNALSLFEQLEQDKKISYSLVSENLWIVKEEVLETFFTKLCKNDKTIIEDFETIIAEGKNIKLFWKELIFFIKQKTLDYIDAGKSIQHMIQILKILDETYRKTKHTLDENTTFLIAILQMIQPGNTLSQTTKNEITSLSSWPQNSQKSKKEEEKSHAPKTKENENNEEWEKVKTNTLLPKKEEDKNERVWTLKAQILKEIKKNNTKGILSLAIKWANLTLDKETLFLECKNHFDKQALSSEEWLQALYDTLETLWHQTIQIKFL